MEFHSIHYNLVIQVVFTEEIDSKRSFRLKSWLYVTPMSMVPAGGWLEKRRRKKNTHTTTLFIHLKWFRFFRSIVAPSSVSVLFNYLWTKKSIRDLHVTGRNWNFINQRNLAQRKWCRQLLCYCFSFLFFFLSLSNWYAYKKRVEEKKNFSLLLQLSNGKVAKEGFWSWVNASCQ